MKADILLIFIIGYILFSLLLYLFGVTDIIYDYLKSSPNNYILDFSFENNAHTKITPDDKSKALKLSKEELGRTAWSFFHSIAAAYPIEATSDDKIALENFINSMKYLYPCGICREHFKEVIKSVELKSNDRSDVVRYFCDLHNVVNKRLNKPIFDCSKAYDHWGGDCGCEIK